MPRRAAAAQAAVGRPGRRHRRLERGRSKRSDRRSAEESLTARRCNACASLVEARRRRTAGGGGAPRRARRQQVRGAGARRRAVLADLEELSPLAPLHQPFALEAIEVLLAELPRAAAGRVLRHGVPSHAAAGRADAAAAVCAVGARRAALRLSRPVVRVHDARLPSGTAMPRADARSSRTSAAAPASARCTGAAASPRRWAFPPSTG